MLCDALATAWNLDVYTGLDDRLAEDMTLTYNVIMKVARGYLLHNHLLYTDNFYSSLFLIHEESEQIDANDLKPAGKMNQTAPATLTHIYVLPYLVASKISESNTH